MAWLGTTSAWGVQRLQGWGRVAATVGPGPGEVGARPTPARGQVAGGCQQVPGHRATPGARAASSPPGARGPGLSLHLGHQGCTKWLTRPFLTGMRAHGSGLRSCVYFAERTAFRCPGSERSRGRWKFLWIKHGAEARWAVWVGSAPSPSRSSPALPPSSPGHPFMPPSWAPSSPPSSGASLTPAGPEQGSLGPLPESGRGCRVTEGSPGRPAPPGPFSSWGPL